MEPLTSLMQHIKSCVTSSKEKLSLKQLKNDYKFLMGENIPYQKYGFKSLEELIQASTELKLVGNGNDAIVAVKKSEKTAHMSELVSRQKNAKRKPARVRFARSVQPPRMKNTSQWRPKSNFQANRYHSSARPQAVRHAQIVSRSPIKPSVASRLVIPEHSTFNGKSDSVVVQNIPQNIAAQPEQRPERKNVSARTETNQRLTLNRLRENMNSIGTLNGYSSTHNGNRATRSNKTNGVTQPNLSENILNCDFNVSTRKRISKRMTELNLDRDSGNSSPTNETLPPSPSKTPESAQSILHKPKIPILPISSPSTPLPPTVVPNLLSSSTLPKILPEFSKTDDPLTYLKSFAEFHKLGEVVVHVTQVNPKRNKFYCCMIKVGQEHTYRSYPNEFHNPLEAQAYCAKQALDDLIPKCKRKSLMVSSEKDILDRIPPMIEKHQHGLFASQLYLDYMDKYNELLSDDWLKIIDISPCVKIEKIADNFILYHCKPGDRGQQRSAGGLILPVSVPTNTVQFGEDGKLLCAITRVVSANEIWCEQIDNDESTIFADMFDRMQIYYQEHEKQMVPETILKGGYYIAKFENVYYRVRVLEIEDDNVECFFIDSGEELVIPKTEIFTLIRVYATSQAQAFVCRLSGLEDLYEMSANSECLASLCDLQVYLEMASDIKNNDEDQLVLPVFMYDTVTGSSINEGLITKLTMELATPHLQPDGITEVYVSHIESNGDVYVQVRTQSYDNLLMLKAQIEEQFNANPPTNLLYLVSKSNSREKLYFKQHSGLWYRIKIIDWSPDNIFAQIYFVDEGHTDVIRVSEEKLYPLENLNEVLNNYPSQAVRVRMALDKTPENFVDLARKAMPKTHPILLKFVGSKVENIPLVKLFKRNTDGGLFCINESIAIQTELSNKKDDEFRNKFKLLGVTDHVPSTGTLKCPPLPPLGDDADFFQVLIPMAVSPYNFIVQPFEFQKQLNAMMERLQNRYESINYSNVKIEDIKPGNIYAAKHEDGIWYRTNVIKVVNSGSSVSVFYCDFGYYQTLPIQNILPLDQEFMELPYMALKAKLTGIKPKQSKWTMEDCEKFKKLIEKKVLFAKLMDIEKDILYQYDKILKLKLVDTSSEDDVLIGHELVKCGIAVEE